MGGGPGVYGTVVAGFSVWAWMWIGVGVVAVVLVTWLVVRSRPRASWTRSPEEVDRLARKLRATDGPPEQIAS